MGDGENLYRSWRWKRSAEGGIRCHDDVKLTLPRFSSEQKTAFASLEREKKRTQLVGDEVMMFMINREYEKRSHE